MTVPSSCGTVWFVGAGPGDPDLITVKGRRILESADAVLFDHLAPAALLDLAPKTARRIKADGSDEEVQLDTIQVGDSLRVRPGDKVTVSAAEGRLIEALAASGRREEARAMFDRIHRACTLAFLECCLEAVTNFNPSAA